MIELKGIHTTTLKNTAGSKWTNAILKDGIQILEYTDDTPDILSLKVDEKVVQYFFCLKGSINFSFHEGAYQIALQEGESYFFYNPSQQLSSAISLAQNTSVIFIFCSLEKIHELFLENTNALEFLNSENANRKFYKKDQIGSQLEVVLNQIINADIQGHAADVFRYAKVLEVLSLYFAQQARENKESCPFLNDEESVRKIRKAKDILIEQMTNPPIISALAKQVELNEFRLKEGFKSMYGSTLFQYLLEHKMNKGRSMLDSGNYKVQDVAYDLGYNNPSHFISAFKSKFGVTPKKYLQNS